MGAENEGMDCKFHRLSRNDDSRDAAQRTRKLIWRLFSPSHTMSLIPATHAPASALRLSGLKWVDGGVKLFE